MSIRWCGTRGALGGRRLGGADVHAAIDQRRVDADDLDRPMRASASAIASAAALLPERGRAGEREHARAAERRRAHAGARPRRRRRAAPARLAVALHQRPRDERDARR